MKPLELRAPSAVSHGTSKPKRMAFAKHPRVGCEVQELLATAVEMHRSGKLAPAAKLYEQVLIDDEDNAKALHLYGLLHHQQGHHARAAELIGRALAIRPSAFVYHANLAEVFRASGQFDRAIGSCRAALALAPGYPEALCNLGATLQAMGRVEEAIESFQSALDGWADSAVVHNNLGTALREVGRCDEALRTFRRAVELDPSYAPAQSNLGQMLLDLGQLDAALPHCREAVRLQPDMAAMHHNLGNVLRVMEQFVDARVSYLEAMRLDPDLAVSHAHLGMILQKEGKFSEALPWLKRATELEPANAALWESLAELYDEMEQPAESIPCWRRALALGRRRAGPHLSLGWALQEEGHLEEAERHYRAAIEIEPRSANAQLNLGGLHEELGQLELAEAAFREGIQLNPALPLPHARLATLLRGKLPDEDLAALEERLISPSLLTGPRARLLFGLAHVLDARGDYERAADCLRDANSLTSDLNTGRREYAAVDHEEFVDVVRRNFNLDWFARLAGSGSPSQQPVFIFGMPRSGTTLTEQVLASHSLVHGAGELRLARRSFEAIPEMLGRSGPPRQCVPDLDANAARRLADQHLNWLQAMNPENAARIVDKMPDNYLYLGLLAALFPRATFIHCRRDLRDVALSCWMTDFRSIRWANDPSHISARITHYYRLMEHWRAVLPIEIHEIDYEAMVVDLESTARRLVASCGLEWEPACLEFYRSQRAVRTASLTQVRQPIYRQSMGRWKHYESTLTDLFNALPPSCS